jgi:hypothetical protein
MDMDENKLRRIIREEQERAIEENKKTKSNNTSSISDELAKVARVREDFNSKLRRLEELTGKNLSDLKYEKPNNRMTLTESFGCFLIIAMFAAFAIWIAWAIFIH